MKKFIKKSVLFLLFQIIFIPALTIILVFYGPFNNIRDMVVTTAMTTMSHQYFATLFLSDEKINEMLKLLGLEKRKNHLPNELSGGEQQRTSIGRALITNPAIILADEPTGNLDSKASDEVVSLLMKSNKEYKQTILMITHNMEIAKCADRIIKIADGKIVEDSYESV